MSQFFYDRQIRRFLSQIISVFSFFEVEWGKDGAGNVVYHRVPVKYATMDKMTAAIIKDNSENTMLSVPAMSVNITGLTYERERVQDPSFVDKMNVRLRRYDDNTGVTSTAAGNALTVERHMPVPYQLKFNVDIWTSNMEQKLQLLEQILVLFNPAFEIQSTDNYIDWTSLSYIHLEDVSFSNRSVPLGSEETIDIATLSFYCPIWLSPPAKIKKLGVIESIITSIYDADGNFSEGVIEGMTRLGNRIYTTPTGYNLLILNNQAQIYPAGGIDRSGDPEAVVGPTPWAPHVNTFGELKNGITQIRLRKNNPDVVSEIVGTVSYHPTDPTVLLVNIDVDTVPANTMAPVNAIIDPSRSGPGIGSLPSAAAGQRYLLLEPIGNNNEGWTSPPLVPGRTEPYVASAWGGLTAGQYDIVEYNGVEWAVAWEASSTAPVAYVTNLTTALQYKWTGDTWVKSWEGEYPAGTWSLVF